MSTGSGSSLPNISHLSWINLAANAADQIATVVLPVLYVAKFHGDAGDTSLLTIAATLPMLLFSLPMGTLADRSQLRSVLFWGEMVRFISLLGSLIALSLSSPPMLLLAPLAMLGATGTVAFQVAAPAMVARATEGQERHKLNSNIELARSVAVTAGPPLAGILISVAGGGIAFAMAAGFGLAAVLATRTLPALPHLPRAATGTWQTLSEGLRFTLGNRWLRPILFIAMSFNLGWYAVLGVIVAWASSGIGMSSAGIGFMFGCYGIGMVVGALLLNRIQSRISPTVLVRIGPWCGFAFAALISLSVYIPSVWILLIAFFLIGCGPIIWTITTVGIRQSVTLPELLGRVSATIMMASAGARPIGAGVGYIGYQSGGYTGVFLIALVMFTVQAMMISRTALGQHEPEAVGAISPAL